MTPERVTQFRADEVLPPLPAREGKVADAHGAFLRHVGDELRVLVVGVRGDVEHAAALAELAQLLQDRGGGRRGGGGGQTGEATRSLARIAAMEPRKKRRNRSRQTWVDTRRSGTGEARKRQPWAEWPLPIHQVDRPGEPALPCFGTPLARHYFLIANGTVPAPFSQASLSSPVPAPVFLIVIVNWSNRLVEGISVFRSMRARSCFSS